MSPEFEDVMDSTDEFPFAFSFVQSSERQPIKSSGVFDLSVHRFYTASTFLIDGFPFLRQQFPFHPFPKW